MTTTPFKRTLVIHDVPRFREALEFSNQHCSDDEYIGKLDTCVNMLLLGEYGRAPELHIRNDTCRHSFDFFFLASEGHIVLNGGIICHGIGEETFAVQLSGPRGRPNFSIHT